MRPSEVVGELLRRFGAGDLHGASDLLHERVRVVVLGEHALAGTYTGRQAWRRYADALRGLGNGTYHVAEVEHLEGTGYFALVLNASVAGAPGTTRHEWRRLVTYHIEDERIVELWSVDLDANAALPAYATAPTTMGQSTP
jgi:ketosteroid isomerase-like protein